MAPMKPEVRKARIALAASGAIVAASAGVMYLLFSTVLPFLIAGLLACVLQPIVHKLESWMPWRIKRPALCRTLAIVAIYLLGLGVVGGVMALIIPPAIRETTELVRLLPAYYTDISANIQAWNSQLSRQLPASVRQGLSNSLPGAASILAKEAMGAAAILPRVITGTLTLIIGLLIVPMFLYYLLKDQEALSRGVYSVLPESIQYHLHHITVMTGDVVGAHMRSQLLLGLVVGTVMGVGLYFLGVPYSLLLGVVAGITELIPILGPWLGGAVGILVTLATAPDKVLWVLLLYLAVQQVESLLLVPRIQGHALRLHPMLIMLIVVVASQLAGIWGIIIGPPLVAVVRDLVRYFHREWHRPSLVVELPTSTTVPGNLQAAHLEGVAAPDAGPPRLVE
ncbi:MAG: AI-2E family transporter [Dehalococcoidia bacterium]|nr:AI-2E family transporter [Dehalococcoidia bacterium]MSQ17500.1 AI-2E family transporter [Dehalococcoidia bacterium]